MGKRCRRRMESPEIISVRDGGLQSFYRIHGVTQQFV